MRRTPGPKRKLQLSAWQPARAHQRDEHSPIPRQTQSDRIIFRLQSYGRPELRGCARSPLAPRRGPARPSRHAAPPNPAISVARCRGVRSAGKSRAELVRPPARAAEQTCRWRRRARPPPAGPRDAPPSQPAQRESVWASAAQGTPRPPCCQRLSASTHPRERSILSPLPARTRSLRQSSPSARCGHP